MDALTFKMSTKSSSIVATAIICMLYVPYLILMPSPNVPLSTARRQRIISYMDSAVTPEYLQSEVQNYIAGMSPYELDENDVQRRRLQDICFFCNCCDNEPTEPPSMPPTPAVTDLPNVEDDSKPYIYVDFENAISYNSANQYCHEQLGTELAALDVTDTRYTQPELVAEMDTLCRNGDDNCWIGLLWDNATNQYDWENGQVLVTNNNYHPWQNGEPVPASALGILDFCVIMGKDYNFQWKNIVCESDDDAATRVPAALCRNPKYDKNAAPAPTPRPTQAYVHIGCYKDNRDRAMTKVSGRYTIDMCQAKCSSGGYSYFAMQNPPGRECYCSSSLYDSTRYGKATNCDGQLGGSWSNSIHKIGECDPATSQYRNIGCYRDTKTRAMTRYLGNRYDVNACFTKCKSLGFTYFGMQTPHGGQCFCSSSFYESTRYGQKTNCNGEFGGMWANNLYQIASDGGFCMTTSSGFEFGSDESSEVVTNYVLVAILSLIGCAIISTAAFFGKRCFDRKKLNNSAAEAELSANVQMADKEKMQQNSSDMDNHKGKMTNADSSRNVISETTM